MKEYISIIVIAIVFCFSYCKPGDAKLSPENNNDKIDSFDVHVNRSINEGTYWYYRIGEGEKRVYEINMNGKVIIFETDSSSFIITSDSLQYCNVQVIINEGGRYKPVKGTIKGKEMENSNLELSITSLEFGLNEQYQQIDYQGILSRKNK